MAEHFYSIQGEGVSAGVPAVFLRLAGCNLMCGGRGTEKDGALHHGATWRCDTIEVWQKGIKSSGGLLASLVFEHGYDAALRGGAHLVITGGEPLLHQQEWVKTLKELLPLIADLYVEVETNGTLTPNTETIEQVAQWNVSPKLRSSGETEERRINEQALRVLASVGAWFKFVCASKDDVEEVASCFVRPFQLPKGRVLLMPAGSTREELRRTAPIVANWCKTTGYRYSPRLHVDIWDKKVGV